MMARQARPMGDRPLRAADAITAENDLFDIRVTPMTRSIRIRLRGIWDHDIFDQYELDYVRVVRAALRRGPVDFSLVDAGAFGIQSGEILERFAAVVRRTERSDTRRTAIVVSAIVNKVQAREAGDLLNARYFRTVETAKDWLFSGEA